MDKEVCPACGQVIHKKRFVPPTLEEIKQYIQENNLSVDSEKFYKHFTVGNTQWIDSEGKPVRNWKQKIQTWASYSTSNSKISSSKIRLFPIAGKICAKCPMPAVYKGASGSYDHYYCAEHMPEAVKEKYE